ncbi:class I SAM-dependent methyltransferase [Helicobacter labetoulli]|uniref:class I SAM-dependent methyltransferase n=1 Tax=Helicobacter labetoulli TaxID=2315333 RepID=UPI0039E92918
MQQCLKNTFNISYHIKDAAQTGFADNEVDYICSYSVLEHIPLDSIRRIFSECYRVLKPNGRIVFLIDYQDHYSYFDSNLSIYNFLRFSSKSGKNIIVLCIIKIVSAIAILCDFLSKADLRF